jgi:hypothetical protein
LLGQPLQRPSIHLHQAFQQEQDPVSIFGKIKDAIFGHAQSAPAQQPQAQPSAQASAQASAMPQMSQQPQAQQPAVQQPQQPVDVDAILADLASKKGEKLNYQSSIVDLMKLLGLDASLANREELAQELGYQGARDGSAEMNIWLHKRVMEELAKNGGKVSPALMH